MHPSDSLVSDLITKVKSLSQSPRQDDPVEALRQPAFEEFLTKINMGVALYSSSDYYFYASKSLSRMLGYTIEKLYAKGPSLLQQIIAPHDQPLVSRILKQCQAELSTVPFPVSYPRISFDFHILSGGGELKRVYQHILPNAVMHNHTHYTLFILHDFSGFKTSPVLNYRLSHLGSGEKFVTLSSGQAGPACPYPFTKSELQLLQLLAAGKGMEAIAHEKQISVETVKKHRSNLLLKAGNKNMVALLKEGLHNGWIKEWEFSNKV